jgi:hypothetical protein
MGLNLIVRQVVLDPAQPPHRQVRALHGCLPGQTGEINWQHTSADAVEYLQRGLFSYFLQRNQKVEPLVLGITAEGEKFLKALSDAAQPLTLLGLPIIEPNPQPSLPL